MAKLEILAPFILSYEGGYVNHPNDPGGATNRGVTIATWRQVGYDKDGDGDIDTDDLRLITPHDATERVMRPHYWNRWKADQIQSQAIANILVDWVWASGAHAIRIPQRLLRVKADGLVGPATLAALNAREPSGFFSELQTARRQFISDIIARNPRLAVFRDGWLRRLEAIQYRQLIYNDNTKHPF